ncbi:putative aminopeptidase YsdC [Fervidicola ferrireducens]|uniref:Putative aminopeptidase YsdC n=1 Tax=Fervidicola ferrireducens TaxID=520764 RepID=A0A140L109_9FIRM|nr:M42 family metallopeptidase [Fervidicola ferrireducens]KXG74234.1 putative aminopeptidase YsdC [Fervidicola ferrireducens]
MELKEMLMELLSAEMPSGYEVKNNTRLVELFKKHCNDVAVDKLGNVIGRKGPENAKVKIMLAAHMDEIGLMVKQIDERGFIRFSYIGGIDPRILPAQEVIIHGREKILGVIGSKPPHIQEPEERNKALKSEDMFIDTGLSAERVKQLVRIGDVITFKRKPVELLNGCFAGNALDDRAGLAAILCCLEELDKLQFSAEVFAVATAQEEVGLRGAIVSTYHIYPDIGVAVDVCHGNMADVAEEETQKLGKGPAIALGPNIHPKLYERLKNIAEDYKIPYQLNPEPSATGTDAWAMQITKEGIPTALISIPLRYMHTTVETLSLEDIKLGGRLLALFISSVDEKFVEGLKCY